MKKLLIIVLVFFLFPLSLFAQDNGLVYPFLIILDWLQCDSLITRAAKITSTLELDGSVSGDMILTGKLNMDYTELTTATDPTRYNDFRVDVNATQNASVDGLAAVYGRIDWDKGDNSNVLLHGGEFVASSSSADESVTLRGAHIRTYVQANADVPGSTARTNIGADISARAGYVGGNAATPEQWTCFTGARIWMAPYFSDVSNINNFHGLWIYNEHPTNAVTNAIMVNNAASGGYTNGLNFTGANITNEIVGSQGEYWNNTTNNYWKTDAGLAVAGVNPNTQYSLYVGSTGVGSPRGIVSRQSSATAGGASFSLKKSRGTLTAGTIITTGDTLGTVNWWGGDANEHFVKSAQIAAISSGTIASTRIPSYLSFAVSTDAAPSVMSERMRLSDNSLVPRVTLTGADGDNSYWELDTYDNMIWGNASLYVYGTTQFQKIVIGPESTTPYICNTNAGYGSIRFLYPGLLLETGANASNLSGNICLDILANATKPDGEVRQGDTGTAGEYNRTDSTGIWYSAADQVTIGSGITVGKNGGTSGLITFVASDNDQQAIQTNTSDQLTFTGAVGGYDFDSKVTVTDSITIGKATATDNVTPYLRLKGDADSDGSATTTDELALTLSAAATPTNAYWNFTSTQSAGYIFDKSLTTENNFTMNTTAADQEVPILTINYDQDSDASALTAGQFKITPAANATPSNSTINFSGAGSSYTFDKEINPQGIDGQGATTQIQQGNTLVVTFDGSPMLWTFAAGTIVTVSDTLLIRDATLADSTRIYDNGTNTVISSDNPIIINNATRYVKVVSLADVGEHALPTGVAGFGQVMIGDNVEWAQIRFTSAGVVTLVANSANVGTTNDVDTKLNIYDGGAGIIIENQLGSTLNVLIDITFMTP